MARRSSGGGLWLLVGALVLVAMVPREVWIAFGVLAALGLVAFVAIKLIGNKPKAVQPGRSEVIAPPHEPTLAELASSTAAPKTAPGRQPPRAPTTVTARAEPSTSGGKSWGDTRATLVDTSRQRAQALRDKFPLSPARRQPISPQAVPPPLPPARSVAPLSSSQAVLRTVAAAASIPTSATSDSFYAASSNSTAQAAAHAHVIPQAPKVFSETRWVKPGQAVEIAGLTLPGGMVYVGPRLSAANGSREPALISPQLNVARDGDFREQHTHYWPSYSDISPQARRAYLTWLAQGRVHPDCDIGLVFLFFYGLERRVIVDSQTDERAKEDWPAIGAELRRLLAIYGEQSSSFKRYAGELLSWVELAGVSHRLYDQPVPEFPRTYELPPYVRLALGQASVDRKPLPAALALAWLRLSPETYLRTAATRCPEEFARLFSQRYHDTLGAGLVLPKNRTKLKFVYQPASSGLSGADVTMKFGDIPDVTALTAPIKALREIAEQCADELGSYSRLLGKDPARAGTLDALLLLPASLWPPAMQARLRELTGRMREGRLALPLGELLTSLGGTHQPVNRDRVRSLARALEAEHIGFEPHVLAGARGPSESDLVVLFAQPASDAKVGTGAEFQTAALTLQLAVAMASADGDVSTSEATHLGREIEAWAHLTPAERSRLHAHLLWLVGAPPTLAALKKKLEPLSVAARETVAAFMVTLAQSDGFVSPDEVKFLEKLYKALGVEAKRVFSDVHAIGAGGATPVTTKQAEKEGFHLDEERIAAL